MKKVEKIILHVGPEKCGSTSIQKAIISGTDSLGSEISGVLINPRLASNLNVDNPSNATIKEIRSIISKKIKSTSSKKLMLSHESFFKMPLSIANLTKIAAEYCDEVVVILYIRNQADFIESSFGQWIFRSKDRLLENNRILNRHNIDSAFFSGTERHLIAAIFSNWRSSRLLSGHMYINWIDSISRIEDALLETKTVLKVGMLPTSTFSFSLISDFLIKSGVSTEYYKETGEVLNNSFHPAMIEATVNAIELGYKMPGPHDNKFYINYNGTDIQRLSSKPPLINELKKIINGKFYNQNNAVAKKFDIPKEYFIEHPDENREAILEKILIEQNKRSKIGSHFFERETQSKAALIQLALKAHMSLKDR